MSTRRLTLATVVSALALLAWEGKTVLAIGAAIAWPDTPSPACTELRAQSAILAEEASDIQPSTLRTDPRMDIARRAVAAFGARECGGRASCLVEIGSVEAEQDAGLLANEMGHLAGRRCASDVWIEATAGTPLLLGRAWRALGS